jgi:flagellar basal-body rod protein FlgG
MIRSLYTGTSGMVSQQQQIDVTSNNIANVNTTAFKKSRAEFKDLLYQELNYSAKNTSDTTSNPTGLQVGLGSKISAVQKMFHQGSLKETGNNLDIAITGDGFMKIMLPNGNDAYTRDGSLKIDNEGFIVTSNGYKVQPEIRVPDGTVSLNIAKNGRVDVLQPDGSLQNIGSLELHSFINPAGLYSVGENTFLETDNSGQAIQGTPGLNGLGQVEQGFLETSNVQLVNEMTDLITGQRAYEANSKVVQTSEELLQTINNLKK